MCDVRFEIAESTCEHKGRGAWGAPYVPLDMVDIHWESKEHGDPAPGTGGAAMPKKSKSVDVAWETESCDTASEIDRFHSMFVFYCGECNELVHAWHAREKAVESKGSMFGEMVEVMMVNVECTPGKQKNISTYDETSHFDHSYGWYDWYEE